MENTENKGNKSVDELTQERDTLMAEITKLTEEKGKLSSNDKNAKESVKLEEENKQLRELIEKYKEDVSNANKLVAQTLREFSSKEFKEPESEKQKQEEELKSQVEEFIKGV